MRCSVYSLCYYAFLFISIVHASLDVEIGQPCDPSRSKLAGTTHQFISDCISKAYCDPKELVCKPKGCRSEEFPFGYKQGEPLPPMCPDGTFCPDEGDVCLPQIAVGDFCQMNRDDECQPAPNAADIQSAWNHKGSLCLGFKCYWANATVGQPCVFDNVVYTGYRNDGSEFGLIISRDNCQTPGLFCNGKTSVCERAHDLGESCEADKECQSHNCGGKNTCVEPAGFPWVIPVWQYVLTALGIVSLIAVVVVVLFHVHKRQRAARIREMREYYHEQTTYRNSIVTLHTAARDRTSIISTSSFVDEHGYRTGAADHSRRSLLHARTISDDHPHSHLRKSMIFGEDETEYDAQRSQLLPTDDSHRDSTDYSQPSSSKGGPVYYGLENRASDDFLTGEGQDEPFNPYLDTWK